MTAGATREGAVWFDGHRFVTVQLPAAARDVSWGWSQLMLVDREGDWWFGPVRVWSGFAAWPAPRNSTAPDSSAVTRPPTASPRTLSSAYSRIRVATCGWRPSARVGRTGSRAGITLPTRHHHYGSADDLPDLGSHFVSAFAEHAGDVTIGFSGGGGLARYRGGRFTRLARTTRRRSEPSAICSSAWTASCGRRPRAAACCGSKPRRPIVPSSRGVTMAQGLSSNEIGAIVEDRERPHLRWHDSRDRQIDPRSLRSQPACGRSAAGRGRVHRRPGSRRRAVVRLQHRRGQGRGGRRPPNRAAGRGD